MYWTKINKSAETTLYGYAENVFHHLWRTHSLFVGKSFCESRAILFYVVLYNRMMVYVENPHIGQRQTRKPKRKTLNITIISKEKITYVYLQNRDFNGQHKMVFG